MSSVMRCLVAFSGLLVVSGFAHAQGVNDSPWEKFRFSVGAFVTQSSTRLQVNSDALGVGAVVDLESALGVE
ncbi:MAG: hypothetical protein GTO41_27325, partial [Burkholderiales bacterium]|nr:hypothetical protein [Burkholderiales bacterium]